LRRDLQACSYKTAHPRTAAEENRVVHHLQQSTSEEENADQLLKQLAKPLMSSATMPEAVI
jgi:hypothetical protein